MDKMSRLILTDLDHTLLGIADEVTLTNDEDGVAKWIEQNL